MDISATVALGLDSIRLPYLYTGGLEWACRSARRAGFDALDLLLPSTDAVADPDLRAALDRHSLRLATLSTGGGPILRGLHLCSPDSRVREEAESYVRSITGLAAPFRAGVILGLMAGKLEEDVSREQAFGWLIPALRRLRDHAAEKGCRLLIEPLNRYESNLINTLLDGIELIDLVDGGGLFLLADLFHMNIEEASIDGALRRAGELVGHVHFVDSNRLAPGMGHTDFTGVAAALYDIGYEGFLGVEAYPVPDPDAAAGKALDTYRSAFPEESDAVS